MAIASLVLGILWIYGIGSILALIFGYLGKKEIDRSDGAQTGRGMAIAGIVLGWLGIALVIAGIVLFTTLFSAMFGLAERFAGDSQTERSLTASLDAARSIEKAEGDFADVTPETLEKANPALGYTDGVSSSPNLVSVSVTTTEHPDDTITLAARSDHDVCFSIRQVVTPATDKKNSVVATTYGKDVDATCDADLVNPQDAEWVNSVEWSFPDGDFDTGFD